MEFTYEPIDLSKDAIRLIRLQRGYPNEEIRCEMFEAFLSQSDGLEYEALSYTWGQDYRRRGLLLNGRDIKVTLNLYDALCHLRYGDRDRYIWVDAICINQENDREKGHQVGQMRRVYQNAERVLIWLGPGSSKTSAHMDLMDKLGEQALALIAQNRTPGNQPPADMDMSTVFTRLNVDSDIREALSETFQKLLEAAWFERIWVIQEVAGARRATVLCGNGSLSTRIFVLMPYLLVLRPNEHVRAILDVMPGYLRRAEDSWWNQSHDLRTLLLKFGKSKATDERDLIYALLGISSDVSGDVFPPDYSLRTESVVHNAISFMVFGRLLSVDEYALPRWSVQELSGILFSKDFTNQILEWALRFQSRYLPAEDESSYSEYRRRMQNTLEALERRYTRNMEEAIAENAVELFLQRGSNISMPSVVTAWKFAIQLGREDVIEEILKKGADLQLCRDREGKTLPSHAVEHKKSHMIATYLINGVRLPGTETRGNVSPLAVAVIMKLEGVVQLLLDHGADPTEEVKVITGSTTPLHLVVDHNRADSLYARIYNTSWSSPPWESPSPIPRVNLAVPSEDVNLDWPSSSADAPLPAFRERMTSPVSPLDTLSPRRTPGLDLPVTLRHVDIKISEMLIRHGADVNAKDDHGKTPLHLATQYSRELSELSEVLIQNGADVNAKDSAGITPLHLAMDHTRSTKQAEILIQNGAGVNTKDNLGVTPLHLVTQWGQRELVELLINNGADVTVKDNYEMTPLHLATQGSRRQLVDLLTHNRADINVNVTNNMRVTPL